MMTAKLFDSSRPMPGLGMVLAVILTILPSAGAARGDALDAPGMSSHAGDHDFAFPREDGVHLTSEVELIRRAWSNPTPTGFIKGGGGSALEMLEAGLEPAYGEAASPILSDGILLVSWSQPTGDVTADLDSINHRYFRNEDVNRKLADTYYRIDADWHTIALDAGTGKKLWHNVEKSASINFLSNKRDHNGISGAARNGVYVTISILGHVYAYDLKTGKTLWTLTLEDWNQRAQATKKEMLSKRRIPYLSSGPFGHKRSGAVIVDGIVVLPDLNRGLMGVRLKDGSEVWRTADVLHDQATPRPWRHEGKTWLVCNRASGRTGKIHLVDPSTGKTVWSHETGANPGQLLMGEGYLLLNKSPGTRNDALLTCYAMSANGLRELWTFEDVEANGIQIRPDFGAHRKGVIRDGVLYAKLGTRRGGARMASVDLATGKELHEVAEPSLGLNIGQPFIAEDKLFVQLNSSHSGSRAGLGVYQLEGDGRFRYLGNAMYSGMGIAQATSYQYPIETPYAGGRLFLRAKSHIAAVDLTAVTTAMAEVRLENLWAGFHRPVRALMFADSDGMIQGGRMESPPRKELGVVGTPVHRSDGWMPLQIADRAEFGSAFEAEATFGFVPFSWSGKIRMMPADGDQWTGTWHRHLSGWEKTIKHSGSLDESSQGGFTQRAWPTGWLKDRPVTFFSDLPEGQQRLFLQMHRFTPPIPGVKESQNMTLCLDHDGEKVVAGIGGAFGFNQSYHEIDGSELVVNEQGIKGTALIILNPETWVPGNYRDGGSLAGRLHLDIKFGEPGSDGVFPIRGEWSVEWGVDVTRSGPISATMTNHR